MSSPKLLLFINLTKLRAKLMTSAFKVTGLWCQLCPDFSRTLLRSGILNSLQAKNKVRTFTFITKSDLRVNYSFQAKVTKNSSR